MYGRKVKLRFFFILLIITTLALSVFLLVKSLEENVIFFKSPTEIKTLSEIGKKKIRIGGMVKKDSITMISKEIKFIVTDFKNEINVVYSGVVPNLFAEEKGVVAEGYLKDKNFFLVDETYNSNPLSLKTAIENYDKIDSKNYKKYLILGDMLELGKNTENYHKKLSGLINSSDIDKVFVKGEKILLAYKNLKKEKRGNIFQCDKDVDFILKNIIANNDYLMIKGSNATGLNMICKSMIKGI